MITTHTITSVDSPTAGTLALVSTVHEDRLDAFAHVTALCELYQGIEPYFQVTPRGLRWTWEGVTKGGRAPGSRWSDTVRVVGV